MTKQEIRPIVKAAFQVDELVHQFEDIDIARRQLRIALDEYRGAIETLERNAAQLQRLIKKYETSK